jgi:hypothetical protein
MDHAETEAAAFHVRLSDATGAGHVIADAADAEEAAIRFLELWLPEGEVGEARLQVTDCRSGVCRRLTVQLVVAGNKLGRKALPNGANHGMKRAGLSPIPPSTE